MKSHGEGGTGSTTTNKSEYFDRAMAGQPDEVSASFIHQKWHDSKGHYDNYMDSRHVAGAVAIKRIPLNMGGLDVNDVIVAYEVFTNADSSVASYTEPVVTEDPVAAAPKTADENTNTSSSNAGWSMTPPTQEDGLTSCIGTFIIKYRIEVRESEGRKQHGIREV